MPNRRAYGFQLIEQRPDVVYADKYPASGVALVVLAQEQMAFAARD